MMQSILMFTAWHNWYTLHMEQSPKLITTVMFRAQHNW